jgi:ThiF family
MLYEGVANVPVAATSLIHTCTFLRQFLFREAHIGKPKSRTAAAAAKGINPELNVVAHELKCASETENVFNDEFYSKLSGVCTALDNVEARLYMDQVSTTDTSIIILTTMLFTFASSTSRCDCYSTESNHKYCYWLVLRVRSWLLLPPSQRMSSFAHVVPR